MKTNLMGKADLNRVRPGAPAPCSLQMVSEVGLPSFHSCLFPESPGCLKGYRVTWPGAVPGEMTLKLAIVGEKRNTLLYRQQNATWGKPVYTCTLKNDSRFLTCVFCLFLCLFMSRPYSLP